MFESFHFRLFLRSLSHKKYVYLYFSCEYMRMCFWYAKSHQLLQGFLLKNMNVIPQYLHMFLSTWQWIFAFCVSKTIKIRGVTSLFYNRMRWLLAVASLSLIYWKFRKHIQHNWHTCFHRLPVEVLIKPMLVVYVGTYSPEDLCFVVTFCFRFCLVRTSYS